MSIVHDSANPGVWRHAATTDEFSQEVSELTCVSCLQRLVRLLAERITELTVVKD